MTTLTKDRGLTAGIAVAAFAGILAAAILGIVWGGFWTGLALSVLWGWFAVPLFGLPALTIWQAYGLVLLVRTVQSWSQSKKDEKQSEIWAKVFIAPPFICGLFLLVGWFVKAWA